MRLAWQHVGALTLSVWSFGLCFVFLGPLKLCKKLGTSPSIDEDFRMRESETALPGKIEITSYLYILHENFEIQVITFEKIDPKCECQCPKKPMKEIIPELYTPAPNKTHKSLISPRLVLETPISPKATHEVLKRPTPRYEENRHSRTMPITSTYLPATPQQIRYGVNLNYLSILVIPQKNISVLNFFTDPIRLKI